MQKRSKRIVTTVVASIAAVGVATAAWATFTSTTAATAQTKTGDLVSLTVGTGTDAPTLIFQNGETGLWPNRDASGTEDGNPHTGAHIANVQIRVTNNNEVGVVIAASGISAGPVAFNAAQFATNQALDYCNGAVRGTPTIALANGPITIAKGGSATLTVTGIYLDPEADDTCQDKQFNTTWNVIARAL